MPRSKDKITWFTGKQQVVQYHWNTKMQKIRLEKPGELGVTLCSLISCFFIERQGENSWKIVSNDINRGPGESDEGRESPWKIRRVRIKAEVNVYGAWGQSERARALGGQEFDKTWCLDVRTNKEFQMWGLDYLSGRHHHFVRRETWEEQV